MTESTFLDKIFGSTPGKIFIVITQTVLSSLLLLLAFLVRNYGDITLLKYVIVLVIGMLAGFSARRILVSHTWAMKLLAALLSISLSLAVMYILSGGFLGINLGFEIHQNPDWPGLAQLALASAGAVLVVTAFRPPARINDSPTPELNTIRSTRESKPALVRWPLKLGRSPSKKSGQNATRSSGVNNSAARLAIPKRSKKTTSTQKLAVSPAPKTRVKKPAASKKARVRKKKEIKLVGDMEHTCPYCLDPVEPNDPRGVKVCPICKTHHHADCWGITGACQIPHSQEKN